MYFHQLPSSISEAYKKCSNLLIKCHFWRFFFENSGRAIFSGAKIFENMAPIENLRALFGGSKSVKEHVSGA